MQIDKILDNINAHGPLTCLRASHLANLCGHFAFVSITEPTKVDEAFMKSEWIQALQDELHKFKLNNVWELVKRPNPHKHNIIGIKWIYSNKQDENGLVVRNKARLVAQGYTQVEGMISMKLLHLLLDLKLFEYCLLMLTIIILSYIKWM